MCGIAGYFTTSQRPPSDAEIGQCLERMKNRGPDHQNAVRFTTDQYEVGLLHSRLSIIDLDPRSNQPFSIGDTTVVFNGEIYNYIELRQDLLRRGIQLITSSDTEILLHYYRLHGESCVDHFEGMWAFAIWDGQRKSLFLSRDRFGEKPLYFTSTVSGDIYFGSEIKFLKALSGQSFTVNRTHLLRSMLHGYKALYKTGDTYFDNVGELRYAQSMTINTNTGKSEIKRYWHPKTQIERGMSQEDAIRGARKHLLESVRIRLRSDVPLAFCLSGGVDSATLASIAVKEFNAKIKTFSIIDDDERYNEEGNIRATIEDLGCDHELIRIPQEQALPRLKALMEYHDVPVATISYYVHSLISQAVSEGGYRVTFSGTSADELFTGYYDHFLLHLHGVRNRPDYDDYRESWEANIAAFIRNPILKNPDLYADNENFREHIFDGSSELRPFFRVGFDEPFQEEHFTADLLRNRMLNELFHEATPVILHEDDLNSMCYSVENRSPYLDTRLFQFAYSIPVEHLIRDGFAKYVLREAVSGILNEQVRLDRKKKGFNASINSMIDFQDHDVREYLLEPTANIFEIVDRARLISLLDRPSIPNHLSKFLFNVVNAKMFLEQN